MPYYTFCCVCVYIYITVCYPLQTHQKTAFIVTDLLCHKRLMFASTATTVTTVEVNCQQIPLTVDSVIPGPSSLPHGQPPCSI